MGAPVDCRHARTHLSHTSLCGGPVTLLRSHPPDGNNINFQRLIAPAGPPLTSSFGASRRSYFLRVPAIPATNIYSSDRCNNVVCQLLGPVIGLSSSTASVFSSVQKNSLPGLQAAAVIVTGRFPIIYCVCYRPACLRSHSITSYTCKPNYESKLDDIDYNVFDNIVTLCLCRAVRLG